MQKQKKQPNTKEHEQIQPTRHFFSGVARGKAGRCPDVNSADKPMGLSEGTHGISNGCR